VRRKIMPLVESGHQRRLLLVESSHRREVGDGRERNGTNPTWYNFFDAISECCCFSCSPNRRCQPMTTRPMVLDIQAHLFYGTGCDNTIPKKHCLSPRNGMSWWWQMIAPTIAT
jgi:hypothetical protein